jgi:hypothetical protein
MPVLARMTPKMHENCDMIIVAIRYFFDANGCVLLGFNDSITRSESFHSGAGRQNEPAVECAGKRKF